MKITRLSWAGLMIEGPNTTLYIDPLQNVSHMTPFLGEPKYPIFPVPFPKTTKANALITHIHPDHFDQTLLRELVGINGNINGPESVSKAGKENDLKVSVVKLYEPFTIGDFTITAVPAVDWVGDEQVSYIVSDGKHQILHGGDTNWHGYWWLIARQYGKFDLAFLPVNGVVGTVPGLEPASGMFGTMTPAQAVTATRILGAKTLVPIHYNQFYNAPSYIQFPNIEHALNEAGISQDVFIYRLKDGEILKL